MTTQGESFQYTHFKMLSQYQDFGAGTGPKKDQVILHTKGVLIL